MKKKSIGIFVRCLKEGGAERAAANLSKDLSDYYNVYIFVFDSTDIAYPFSGTLIDLSFQVSSNLLLKAQNQIRILNELRSYRKKYDIETVISFMPTPNRFNLLSRGKGKSIISIRTTTSRTNQSKISDLVTKWSGQKADAIVALSEGVKDDLIHNYHFPESKTSVIYNSCDTNWYIRDNESTRKIVNEFDFEKPTIVTVGRLIHQKGQWHLLRAISLVATKILDIQVVIIGQGQYLNGLREYALQLGIEKNVHFMGFIKDPHEFIKRCTAFVFPSIIEGFGNALLEALGCGIPVIAADCISGPREILDPGTLPVENIKHGKYGILIPAFSLKPFDVKDMTFEKSDSMLSEAILQLLMDSQMREFYIDRGYERIKDFSPEVIKKQWVKLIGHVERNDNG